MEQRRILSDEYANARVTYQYPLWISLLNKMIAIFAILLGTYPLLIAASSFVATLGSWQQFAEWAQNAGRIFVFWSLLWLIGAGILIHAYPDITVSPAGLETTVLFGIPVHIPWNEVLELKERPLFSGRRNVRIILVKRLTPWHRLISLACCLDLRPGLLIMDRMEGYHELVKTIEAHIGQS